MARTHKVPNHLNVQDTLFLGLTARQVATFMAFASPAYGMWDQLTVAPLAVRGVLAGLVVLAGIAFALLQPGGRPLDEWTFEFECAACGERFEVSRPMAEHERLREQPPLCAKCGQQTRELIPLINCKIATG